MTKKKCTNCGKNKPASEFSVTKSRNSTYLTSRCKKCLSEISTDGRIRRRKLLRIKLVDYLHAHPCVDCGEKDILVLEFDHRDASAKEANVATLMAHAHSWTRIQREIEHCDVRCANCHRRKTHKQLGWHDERSEKWTKPKKRKPRP